MNQFFRLLYTLIIGLALAGCNDEVFIKLPDPEEPPPEPSPDTPEPEFTDSLMLRSLVYAPESLTMTDDIWELEGKTNFYNYDSEGDMWVLFDNYNSSLVSISNSTYYVTPWAKEGEPLIGVPYYDSQSESVTIRPDFIPFKFGITPVGGQLMAGHKESLHLPANTCVQATIYITRRKLEAMADIEYFITDFPQYIETGWVKVVVWQPIDIRVEWSDILPATRPD